MTERDGMKARAGLQRRALIQGVMAAMGGAAAGLPWAAQAQTRPAQRLVVLGGALTEVVYQLGAQGLLVGTDTTSLFPEAAQRTPKVGYMRQLSAEGVLSLRPDVLLGTEEAGPRVVLDQVRSAGVRIELVPASHNWAEVQRKVTVVGQVVGRESAAQALQVRLDAEWARVQQQVAAAPRKPRALFILSHGGSPMVAGTGTAADALIRFAGGLNAVTGFAGYRPWTAEALAEAAPEVLLNTTQGIEAMGGERTFWQRPELALTPAFSRKALVAMDANHLLGFGPRLPGAVQELHTRMRALVA
ncbi:ABC transporter substrate-binding protein [Acidovorax sp. DW039]|uniref:heme/hemin ABC transporter substrate-binding protein n=1 Tax=Acidovorax sp. DW039 TaxID=3095606 RepID=UPI00308E3AC8|nr:ABC transporter substrate-binding protein [Acidovorax sp. DW039]